MSTLILVGSARSDGLTAEAAAGLAGRLGENTELIDLLPLRIDHFQYGGDSAEDDFLSLIGRLARADALVFATPVYWYAMSGLMKTLFDRFTDLLGPGEAGGKGRALAGRRTWLLSTGSDPTAPVGFEVPFERTSAYLGMVWRGACYVRIEPDQRLGADAAASLGYFAAEILADMKKGAAPKDRP